MNNKIFYLCQSLSIESNQIPVEHEITYGYAILYQGAETAITLNPLTMKICSLSFSRGFTFIILAHELLHNINTLDTVTVIYHIWCKRDWLCRCQIIEWQCVKSKWCPGKLISRQWRHISITALCCWWMAVTLCKFDAFITTSLPTMSHHYILLRYFFVQIPFF